MKYRSDCEKDIGYVVAPLFFIGVIMFLRSFIPMKRRQPFEEKGKRYSGKIMYAESIMGKGCTYYLLIEFRANGKRLVRRTEAYPDNSGYNFIRVDIISGFGRKRENYV